MALRAYSYTPRFAFTLHLKLIPFLCVCVCARARTCGVGGLPGRLPFLPGKAKEKSVAGGKGKVSVLENVDRMAIKSPPFCVLLMEFPVEWDQSRMNHPTTLIPLKQTSLISPFFPCCSFLSKYVSFPH